MQRFITSLMLISLALASGCDTLPPEPDAAAEPVAEFSIIHSSADVRFVHSNPQFSIDAIASAPLRLDSVHAPLILRAARAQKLEPALVFAVIQAESAFDHEAVSPAGAQGLMQLMPDTAQLLGVKNPFNPLQNIDGGTRYLKYLFGEFEQQELVLAAYNAGPGAVRKYGLKVPPYEETRRYVEIVRRLYQRYREKTPSLDT
jgi:soluble lytic murein transglycosylase-like protein